MFRAGILGKFKKLYIKILNKQFIWCSVISGFMHVTEGHSKKLIFFRFRLFLNFHQRLGFLWREQLPRQLSENIVIEHWKVLVSYYRHSSVWGWAKKRSKHNSGENFQKYSSPLKTMPAEFKQSVGVNSGVSVSVVPLFPIILLVPTNYPGLYDKDILYIYHISYLEV